MRLAKHAAGALALTLSAVPAARAATVDVTATTYVRAGQETRGGQPGGKPALETVAPAFEIVSITARGVTNPVLDDLALVVSTWGEYDIGHRRWDNGTDTNLTGDVVAGYLQGKLFRRHLTLRLGRATVATGAARMLQLDGGEAIALLPGGVRLSGYAGSPVVQRFGSRTSACSPNAALQPATVCGAARTWNPAGGDLAYGGRAGWSWGLPGAPGRGVELGLSANVVKDRGDTVREEAAADLRLQPVDAVTLSALGAYSLYDARVSEISGRIGWSATRALRVEADARHVAPDLFLARNSILSVFTAETRQAFGAGATYLVGRNVTVAASYHLDVEPGRNEGDPSFLGHEAEARVEWERGRTLAGAEVLYLDALDNGYVGARLFGRRELGRFYATADVLAHLFRETVNGEKGAVTGVVGAGVELARGFSAVLAGSAGVTPFLEQTYGVMAKLVYEQTIRTREVR